MILFLIIFLFSNPKQDVKTVYCDRVIYQHLYDVNGEHKFDQLVFFNNYVYPGGKQDYIVTDWILVNNNEDTQRQMSYIMLDRHDEYYTFKILNYKRGLDKPDFYVKTKVYLEVTSCIDVEHINKKVHHEKQRVSIFK